ncbi:MAG: hypothetical protein IV100_17175 [Myxococcales bacterium]|nr:hypothetical protein [Myxococcales bacterium]
MNRQFYAEIALLAFAIGSVPNWARAEEGGGSSPSANESDTRRGTAGGEERVLNSHQFLIPVLMSNPFIYSSFGTVVGAGRFNFTVQGDSADDTGDDAGAEGAADEVTADLEAKLLYFELRFDGQIGIADWVAISFTAGGVGATSTSLDQILNVGAVPSVEIGGAIRSKIWSSNSLGLQFGAEVKTHYSREWVVTPIAAVQGVLQRTSPEAFATGDFPAIFANIRAADMVGVEESLNISPRLLAAWGMGPVGVQTQIGTTHGVGIGESEKDSTEVNFGLHTALDIGYWTRYFPIAIGVEYLMEAAVGDDDDTISHSLAGGAYYSGARDVQLGVSGGWSKAGDLIEIIHATLDVVYIF